ncbi:MAG: hypothetical protein WD845_10995 [Pirellulales bacterium]
MIYRICLLSLAAFSFGCGKTETQMAPEAADPHDVPITEADVMMPASYAEALPQIKGYRDTIRSAIEAGTPAHAHRSLDELDIVLDKLPSIAKDSGVPQEQWETINRTARELRNLFDQLHSAIDEKRAPDYQAVAEQINQAIAKLEQVTQ